MIICSASFTSFCWSSEFVISDESWYQLFPCFLLLRWTCPDAEGSLWIVLIRTLLWYFSVSFWLNFHLSPCWSSFIPSWVLFLFTELSFHYRVGFLVFLRWPFSFLLSPFQTLPSTFLQVFSFHFAQNEPSESYTILIITFVVWPVFLQFLVNFLLLLIPCTPLFHPHQSILKTLLSIFLAFLPAGSSCH